MPPDPKPARRRVTFEFDERSAVELESLIKRGFRFTRVEMWNPEMRTARDLLIPTLDELKERKRP